MLAVVAAGYPRRIRHLSPVRQRALLVIRLATILLLLLLMMRPSVLLVADDKARAVVYVLRDVSPSTQTPDAAGGGTRFDAQQRLITQASEYLSSLDDSVEVRFRDYADSIAPMAVANKG